MQHPNSKQQIFPLSKPRRGFDSSDFQDDNQNTSISQTSANSHHSSIQQQDILKTFQCNPKEAIYQLIDSTAVTIFIISLMIIDFLLLLITNIYYLQQTTNQHLQLTYKILDWITAIFYFIEVHSRLYTYGHPFYFHSNIRTMEYFISIFNFIFILIYAFIQFNWLLITRIIRLLRSFTFIINWRETQLKWRTRQELQKLIQALDKETNEKNKLTKWTIDSKSIVLGERVGEGGFGAVYSGLFRGTLVAVKQIPSIHEDQNVSIEDEAITLVNLRHPNVVLFMGFVHEPEKIWIVTEYCSRGSLRNLLDDKSLKLTESRILKLALSAARGLAYLHGQQPPVLHLDLKTSNILISSGWDAKLADFGLSRSIDRIEKEWFSGTMQYAAPEILESNIFSTAADIYSFGVCLWEMAARDVPFRGMTPHTILWGVVKSNLRPPLDIFQTNDTPQTCASNEQYNISQIQAESSSNPVNLSSGLGSDVPEHLDLDKIQLEIARKEQMEISPLNVDKNLKPSSSQNFSCSLPMGTTRDIPALSENEIEIDKELKEKTEPKRTNSLLPILQEGNRKMDRNTEEMEECLRRISVQSERQWKSRSGFSSKPNTKTHEQIIDIPLKKRSTGIVQPRQGKVEKESDLSNLTHKVTATIQLFDDRPPIARKREVEDFEPENITGSPRSNEIGSNSPFPARVKSTLLAIPARGQLQGNRRFGGRTSISSNSSHSNYNLERSDSQPFMRRMASFSRNETTIDKSSIYSKSTEHNIHVSNSNGIEEMVKDNGRKSLISIPKHYMNLVERCWAPDPNERPSAGEIVWKLVLLIDGQKKQT